MKLTERRRRALSLLEEKEGGSEPLPIDYVIDDECRRVLNLPARPPFSEPFTGWMVGGKKNTNEPIKTSDEGIELIKRWEGLRTTAYLCPANVWTVGYGHTRLARKGMTITHERAEELLKQDLVRFEDAVEKFVSVPITQNQFDALVSFTFNVGINAFKSSTLLRKLNRGNYEGASKEFHRWVHGGGKRLRGLVRRRDEESRLFNE